MKEQNTKTLEWTDDKYAELKLREFGLEFSIGNLSMGDIDEGASRDNRARIGRFDEDLVTDYRAEMDRGAAFPRIVAHLNGEKWIILSGNHRHQAAKTLGAESMDAYLVKSHMDDNERTLIAMSFNRGHGDRQSREEAIAHALWSIRLGKSNAWAAQTFAISEDTLRQKLRVAETSQKLRAFGVDVSGLADSNVLRLATLSNDNVLAAASRVALKQGLTGSMLDSFLREIKETTRSEAAQMAVVSKYELSPSEPDREDSVEVVKNKKASIPRGRQFVMHMSAIEGIVKKSKSLKHIFGAGKYDHDAIKQRMIELSRRLYAVANT